VVGRRVDAVPLAQLGRVLRRARGDDDVGPPCAEEAHEQGLPDAPASKDRDHGPGVCLGGSGRVEGEQPAAEAGEKVDARDTGELAVRLEQLRRLPALDRAPADRAQELDETEVADEAVIPAAEALEADDADRPRPEPPLPLEPSHDRVRRPVVQSLELDRAAEADECCGAARVETQLSQLRRRQRTEVARRWGGVQALGPAGADRADDRLLHSARALRLDQLPAEGAQKRLRNGGDAYGTEAAQVARRAPEHAVVAHTHEKRRVVVVQREQPAETL